MKKTGKHGQFYFVAAIVLASLAIGIISVANYLRADSVSNINDIGEELKIESRKVIEYSLYQDQTDEDFQTTLLDFTGKYMDKIKPEKDVYFLFGTSADITVTGYQREAKKVTLTGDSSTTITEMSGDFLMENIDPGTSDVTLSIGDIDQEFTLTQGKNLYFVITEELNSGKYFVKW